VEKKGSLWRSSTVQGRIGRVIRLPKEANRANTVHSRPRTTESLRLPQGTALPILSVTTLAQIATHLLEVQSVTDMVCLAIKEGPMCW
jgi:hypothetical protein